MSAQARNQYKKTEKTPYFGTFHTVVVDKNNFQNTEVSAEIISSSAATACGSKIIDIEMDPLTSLSVRVTTSSPISEYRLIDI